MKHSKQRHNRGPCSARASRRWTKMDCKARARCVGTNGRWLDRLAIKRRGPTTGEEIIEGLEELLVTLKSGQPLRERFRVDKVRT